MAMQQIVFCQVQLCSFQISKQICGPKQYCLLLLGTVLLSRSCAMPQNPKLEQLKERWAHVWQAHFGYRSPACGAACEAACIIRLPHVLFVQQLSRYWQCFRTVTCSC